MTLPPLPPARIHIGDSTLHKSNYSLGNSDKDVPCNDKQRAKPAAAEVESWKRVENEVGSPGSDVDLLRKSVSQKVDQRLKVWMQVVTARVSHFGSPNRQTRKWKRHGNEWWRAGLAFAARTPHHVYDEHGEMAEVAGRGANVSLCEVWSGRLAGGSAAPYNHQKPPEHHCSRSRSTHHGQLIHQLPLPAETGMESERSDTNESKAEVWNGVADRNACIGGDPSAPHSGNNSRNVCEGVDELGNIVRIQVVELAPVWVGVSTE